MKNTLLILLFFSSTQVLGQYSYTMPSEIGIIGTDLLNTGFIICPDRLNDGKKWKLNPCQHSIRFSGNRIYKNGFDGVQIFEIQQSQFKNDIIIFDVVNITNNHYESGDTGVINVRLNTSSFPIRIEFISNKYETGYFYLLVDEKVSNSSINVDDSSLSEIPSNDILQNTYLNERFDYCLYYPANYFQSRVELNNSDGIKFTSYEMEVLVYGQYNVMGYSLSDIQTERVSNLISAGGKLLNLLTQENFVLIVGEESDKTMVYRKVYLEDDTIKELKIHWLLPTSTVPDTKKLESLTTEMILMFNSCK